jgi:hydrogenase expression/formation protein HypE
VPAGPPGRGLGAGAAPARIGQVLEQGPVPVLLRTRLGTERFLDLPSGEQLPRIC